jgi:hypothetical protein
VAHDDLGFVPTVKQAGKDAVGGLAAFGLGGLQGASVGFGDELSGVGGMLADQLLPEALAGPKLGKTWLDSYRIARDEARGLNKEAEDAHPGAYIAGNLAGGLATAPLMPAGAATTGIRALASAAKAGAGLGAAAGLGSSNADLTQGQIGGAAKDALLGAGVGGAAGLVGHSVGQTIADKARNLSQYLREIGNEQAVSALRPTAGEVKRLLRKDQLQELGDFLLRNEAVTAGATPENIALNLEGLNAVGGKALSGALADLDATGMNGIDKNALLGRLNDLALKAGQGGPALRPVQARYDQAIVDAMGIPGNASFSEAEAIKRGYQSAANYARLSPSLAGEADINIASAARQAIEDAADQAATRHGGQLADRFRAAKDLFGKSAQALELTEGAQGRALARNLASPSDKAAAMMAAAQAQAAGKSGAQSGLIGAVTGAVNNQVRRRTASTLAVGARSASDKLQQLAITAPGKLGLYGSVLAGALERGGQEAFNAHAYVLGQTDPGFQALQQKLTGEADDERAP